MQEPSRRCKKCGHPLSGYNRSDECFRHYSDLPKNSTDPPPAKSSEKKLNTGKLPPAIYAINTEPPSGSIPDIEIVADGAQKTDSKILAERMLSAIGSVYKVSREELCGDTHEPLVVRARQILMYLLWEELRTPAPEIAQLLRKNVLTVKTGYGKIRKIVREDAKMRRVIGNIRAFYRQYHGA